MSRLDVKALLTLIDLLDPSSIEELLLILTEKYPSFKVTKNVGRTIWKVKEHYNDITRIVYAKNIEEVIEILANSSFARKRIQGYQRLIYPIEDTFNESFCAVCDKKVELPPHYEGMRENFRLKCHNDGIAPEDVDLDTWRRLVPLRFYAYRIVVNKDFIEKGNFPHVELPPQN